MIIFWKAIAGALITAVLAIVVGRSSKDSALLLSLSGCLLLGTALLHFLDPVIDFLKELKNFGNLRGDMLTVLLKALGISLVAEIAGSICTESGNASLGKLLNVLGYSVILWLSIPSFQSVLELINRILGGI